MSPIRTSFKSIEQLFESPDLETRRSEIINLLHQLVESARDTEEAGLAVTFAASSVAYMEKISSVACPSLKQRQDWLRAASLELRAAMTLRKAQSAY